MATKFFVVSDIHSYYTPLKIALDKAGFDPSNENHWLIVCGDAFDRGDESSKVLLYLMSLKRKILIRGNHDVMFDTCCLRGYAESYDFHNGTAKTITDLGEIYLGESFYECCNDAWIQTDRYRSELVNYFETEHYIFVHSWIPMEVTYDKASKPWHQNGKRFEYMENWRNATRSEWEEAMWGNPFHRAQDGLNKTGKTIVFGHWHCSAGYALNENKDFELTEFGENACWEPYFNETQGIIGIDRCTAYTGEVNVLVLEDEFLEVLTNEEKEVSLA